MYRVDFDDALRQGLYQKICSERGIAWSGDGQLAWRTQIIAECDHPDEELFCIPRQTSSESYLPRYVTERCTNAEYQVVS